MTWFYFAHVLCSHVFEFFGSCPLGSGRVQKVEFAVDLRSHWVPKFSILDPLRTRFDKANICSRKTLVVLFAKLMYPLILTILLYLERVVLAWRPTLKSQKSTHRLLVSEPGFLLVNLKAPLWLLVSEPGFSGFWRQNPLKNNLYMKKTSREWSEQRDMVDTDHFGFGFLQDHQRFVRTWTIFKK